MTQLQVRILVILISKKSYNARILKYLFIFTSTFILSQKFRLGEIKISS